MDNRTITPRRARRALASLAVLAALAACGDADGDAPAASPDASADAAPYRPGPPVAVPGSASRQSTPPASDPGSVSRQASPAVPAPGGGAQSGSAEVDVESLGFTRGSPDAPVRVVEFSDFGCGYCRQFHMEAWPVLHRDYVETGKVQWKMVPFDVGMFPHARQAVLTGECAGEQGRFEDVRERLFDEQRTWKGGSAGDALKLFRSFALEEGLDMDRFNRCMGQGWRAARVEASNALARQLGVRGTPTFYILGMGIIPGALPAEDFADVLDRVLATRSGEAGS